MALWTAGILLALGVWLIGFGGFPFIYWSPLNCKYEDVDIHTGRIRTTRMLVWLKVSERIEDSALTKALAAEDVLGTEPEWRRVNTLSPGIGNSPHYAFHGAISQIGELESFWESFPLNPQMKRETALTVLSIWNERGGRHGSFHTADRFIDELGGRLSVLDPEPTDEAVRSAAAEAIKKIRGEEPVKP
jgi:hypothetical protein